jgi:predicted TPR repeat methyltransferase
MNEPALGQIAPLPGGVDLVPGTDIDTLWEPFRFFEAGHHLMDIMNPLSPRGLDQVVTAIDRQPTERLLDIACGHGELLLRVAAGAGSGRSTADTIMTGVDLSPWTLRRAHQRLANAEVAAELFLGDGARYLEQHPGRTWDVISLIGASWIWGGFEPSVAALVPRLNPGGRLAIAEVIVASPEARDQLAGEYGTPLTSSEVEGVLADAGLVDLTVIPITAQDWRDYDDRVMSGIRRWAELFPENAGYLRRQQNDVATRADDTGVTWQVWVGTAGPS